MAESWTVRKVVAWLQDDLAKRGIETARLEADLLVAHALRSKRIALYLDLDRPLIDSELQGLRKLVERRRAREPMAYILGEREFYGRTLLVTPDVLIPRPDTETLVEELLRRSRSELGSGALLDLCTGSGAIAVTLAAELSERVVVATDLSRGALSVAEQNARKHDVLPRVALRLGDLYAAVAADERFAAIVANPPYIGSEELATLAVDVRDYEPRIALDAGPDALQFYRRIVADAPSHLLEGGTLLVEVGYTQASAVTRLFSERGFSNVRTIKDLGGIERVVAGVYAAASG